jgi:hypothetical protein
VEAAADAIAEIVVAGAAAVAAAVGGATAIKEDSSGET